MYREVGACWSQHPTRPGRSHRYRPTARADGDAFSAIFDETAGICCSPLIPVSNEGMDLVSTHLFGTIADTAHHLLLHDEMGTSTVTCPTAPPLPARSTGSTRLCDEDRSPRHPKLSCRAAPARSRRATSAPSALLAPPRPPLALQRRRSGGRARRCLRRTSCHSGWTVFAFWMCAPTAPFQQRITVEPAAVLADLRQPGPHRRNGCDDGQRPRGPHGVRGHEFVPWEHRRDLIVVGSPRVHPWTQPHSAQRNGADHRHQARQPCSLLAHTPRLGTTHTCTKGRRSLR